MTYETTIPGEEFFPFIKSAIDFVGDAKVIFGDDILLSALDTANVLLIDTTVVNPTPPPEPIEVILDLRCLAGLTSAKNDVTFRLDGSSRVQVKTGRMEYTLSTVIDPHLKDRRLPEKIYPVKLKINAEAFADGVAGMIASNKAIEELQGFWFIAESEDVFYFQDGMKQYSKAVFKKGDEYDVLLFDEPAASMFSLDYIEDMAKHVKKFDTVTLCLGNEQPVILIATSERRKLAYALADRRVPV
jgi:hypothetical protein